MELPPAAQRGALFACGLVLSAVLTIVVRASVSSAPVAAIASEVERLRGHVAAAPVVDGGAEPAPVITTCEPPPATVLGASIPAPPSSSATVSSDGKRASRGRGGQAAPPKHRRPVRTSPPRRPKAR